MAEWGTSQWVGHVHSGVSGQVTMGGQVGHVTVGHMGSEEHGYRGDLITIVTIVNKTGNKTSQV